MEPLQIPNHDRDDLLVRIIFYVAFFLFVCAAGYFGVKKEGLTVASAIFIVFIIPGLAWFIKKRIVQLQRYTPFGLIINEEGITFSSDFYNPSVFLPWSMIKGFTTVTIVIRWTSMKFLKIKLEDPEACYSKHLPLVKPLFKDKESYYYSLQELDCEPEVLTEKIMNYRNTMIDRREASKNLR